MDPSLKSARNKNEKAWGLMPFGYWDSLTKEEQKASLAQTANDHDAWLEEINKPMDLAVFNQKARQMPRVLPESITSTSSIVNPNNPYDARNWKYYDEGPSAGKNGDWLQKYRDARVGKERLFDTPRPQPKRPNPKQRSEEHCNELAELFPPDFPNFRVAESLNDIGAYLANASYFISLGGTPAPDLKYGIVAVPLGQEKLLFGKAEEDPVMTSNFLEAVRNAQLLSYADGSLYDIEEDSSQFRQRRFARGSGSDYSAYLPLVNPVIDPAIQQNPGKGTKRKREARQMSASPPNSQAVAVLSGSARGHAISRTTAAPNGINKSEAEGVDKARRSKRLRTASHNEYSAKETEQSGTKKATRTTKTKAKPTTYEKKPKAKKADQAVTQKKVAATKNSAQKKKPPAPSQNRRTTRTAAQRG